MNSAMVLRAFAYKRLAMVDLPGKASHQHELNGVGGLRQLFGTDAKVTGEIEWFYFGEDQPVRQARGRFTFYDARAKSSARTGRCEWRFYYEGNFLAYGQPGDILVIGTTSGSRVLGLVFQKASTWLNAAEVIFGLSSPSDKFDAGRPLVAGVGAGQIRQNANISERLDAVWSALSVRDDVSSGPIAVADEPSRVEHLPFRPRARMLVLLGDQLIRDAGIAVFELAKNSFDADSSRVELTLAHVTDLANASITIEDDGCGMDWDTVVNVWLEPGTDYRQQQKLGGVRTPIYNRLPLGEKGIGRFAAHKLGRRIKLITRKQGHPEVIVDIDWNEFTKERYLSDAHVKVSECPRGHFDGKRTGTRIEIHALNEELTRGTIRQIYRAITSICSPFRGPSEFSAVLRVVPDDSSLRGLLRFDRVLEIAPYRATCLVEGHTLTYDYDFVPSAGMHRIEGRSVTGRKIDIPDLQPELFSTEDFGSKVGDLLLEFRIFDLDSLTLELAVTDKRGFRDFMQNNGGIRVYRDGMRIYDYGEPGNDWLDLGGTRVNAPTARISNNQIIGAVHLAGATSSGLVEKTNREGFVEDSIYHLFRRVVLFVLTQIVHERNVDKERLRTIYAARRIQEPVIADLAILRSKLEPFAQQAPDVLGLVDSVAAQYREMRETLLTAAGTGLTLSVVIHEVEKAIKSLAVAVERGSSLEEMRNLATHLNELIEGLTYLTRKSGRRVEAFSNLVRQTLLNTGYRIRTHRIDVTNAFEGGGRDFSVNCTRRLIIATLMNLIDNSIYWLSAKGGGEKRIYLGASDCIPGGPVLFIADNGPGFQDHPESLVQPFLTRKPEGMGLGLHIAHKVMEAHGGRLIFPSREELGIGDAFTGAIVGLQFNEKL